MRYSVKIFFVTDRFLHPTLDCEFKSFQLMKKNLLDLLDDSVQTIIITDNTIKNRPNKRYFNLKDCINFFKTNNNF